MLYEYYMKYWGISVVLWQKGLWLDDSDDDGDDVL